MEPHVYNGARPQPPASWREKVLIVFILVVICAGLWILLYPPLWLANIGSAQTTTDVIADPVHGNPDAQLKIIEYNDFACVKCREWYQSGVEDLVLQKYGDRVAFVWRDLPLTSSYSIRAAEAAQCANAQGKFREYHDYLYEIGQGFMDSKLIEYAGAVGLDVKKFDQCLIGGEMQAKVADNRRIAYEDRVQAVPVFMINGERVVGAASLDSISQVIDAALK